MKLNIGRRYSKDIKYYFVKIEINRKKKICLRNCQNLLTIQLFLLFFLQTHMTLNVKR